jgi:sugar O-acyltransferase (sialic acid O-acetyltransferase NeuD family)
MKIFGVVGVGGFGREVMPVAAAMLAQEVRAKSCELVFVAEDAGTEMINGHRCISEEEFLSLAPDRYFSLAVSDGRLRHSLNERYLRSNAKPFEVRAANSVVMDCNEIGDGAILCPFVTVTSNAVIGRHFQANLYSYVAHDCVIGDYVTFGPGVQCNGRVIVEDFAYIGTGVAIRNGSRTKPLVIGRGAIIGMGAVVTKDVAAGTTVVGNPARTLSR